MNKKFMFGMLILCALVCGGYAQMNKGVNAIGGKDGIFAVMETAKGDIVINLSVWRKEDLMQQKESRFTTV